MPGSLTFTASGYLAKHVCYTNQGDASYDGATVTLSNGHVTRALPCPFNPANALEDQAVDGILIGAVSATVDAGTLTISKDGGKLVYVNGTPTTHDLPLEGTHWRLETAAADSGASYPASDQQFKIESGQVVADDGLNTTSGPVDVHDGTMTFGDLATSAVGSITDDPVRDVVDAVIKPGDVSYAISGDTLTLTRGSGPTDLPRVTLRRTGTHRGSTVEPDSMHEPSGKSFLHNIEVLR